MFWIKSMSNNIEEIYSRLTKVNEKLSKLERILQYGKSERITYNSYNPYENSILVPYLSEEDKKITDIYKDNVEYRIKGLLLHDAEIDQVGLCDGVIHITDKCEGIQISYLVDLNNKTFIRES